MRKSLLLGTILGGLVAFIWSNISWELLHWHESSLLAFQDEDAVGRIVLDHTAKSGLYIYPGGPVQPGLTPEQKKAAEAEAGEKMKKGPMVFAAVRREGFGSFARGVIVQFLTQLAAAFLLTWLLLKTAGQNYWQRVIFLMTVGLAAGVISDLPNWNWWGFSESYTAVAVVDNAVTWFIAGLAIAKVAPPSVA
jgi:hypothetical protein